jgi:hypothetical protein
MTVTIIILQSHAPAFLDRTGALDTMWFLAQDSLAHVQKLSANRQLYWKIPEQVPREEEEGGGHQTFPIS